MKKIPLFILASFVYSQNLIAQDTIHLKRNVNKIIITDRPPQAFFAEIFGRAIDFSLNYDSRFLKRVDGWGFCVGIGIVSADEIDVDRNILAIPVSVNYLEGKNGKYLEVGAGFTYFNGTINDGIGVYPGGSSVAPTFIIGYRNQPTNGGFMFRTGFSPIITKNDFIPYPYVSFGYNF